jgi:hypothetical protein
VTDPDLIKIINKLGNNVDTWMTTDNVKHLISRQLVNKKWMQSFKYMNNLGELGRIHMRPKDMRNGNNLPTSGVQLIYIASFMKIDKLNILGINLYTVKDDVGNYKISCLTSKENPYKLTNKPHDIKTDLIFVIESFKRMISKGINIKVDSYILRSILDMCKSNIADIEIIKKTISKYDL